MLEWLEVRLDVGCDKRLVYEYRIEPLKCDRDALKQECRLARIACNGTCHHHHHYHHHYQHKAAGVKIRLSKNNDHDGVSHGVECSQEGDRIDPLKSNR